MGIWGKSKYETKSSMTLLKTQLSIPMEIISGLICRIVIK